MLSPERDRAAARRNPNDPQLLSCAQAQYGELDRVSGFQGNSFFRPMLMIPLNRDTMEDAATIHRFWFGEQIAQLGDEAIAKQQGKLWWSKNADFDAQIRQRFAPYIDGAVRGELDGWAETPRGLLALILLTDQFPRNAYRGTPAAFAADAAARRFCRIGLARQFDSALRPVERVFHYLPLEHSEAMADQDDAVQLFSALAEAAPEPAILSNLDFALRHRAVIARFGRFPHRNAIHGRASTPEEIAFLGEPGSRF